MNTDSTNTDSSVVRICVGERLFNSTRGTLEKSPYFKALLSTKFPPSYIEIEGKTALFVDRSGDLFPYVLSFLRNGGDHGVLDDLPDAVKRGLRMEADFYLIEDLKGCLDNLLNKTISSVVRICVGDRLFNTTCGTLKKSPYFRALLKTKSPASYIEIEGKMVLFVDRSGDLFPHILGYLRDGGDCSELEDLPSPVKYSLEMEAAFYKIYDFEIRG